MFGLTKEQYTAIEGVYQELLDTRGWPVYADALIVEIDRRILDGRLPNVFSVDHEKLLRDYKHRVISLFFQMLERKLGQRMIGVMQSQTTRAMRAMLPTGESPELSPKPHDASGTYYVPLDYARVDRDAALAARRYYTHGFQEMLRYAPLFRTWGGDLADVLRDLEVVKNTVLAQMNEDRRKEATSMIEEKSA